MRYCLLPLFVCSVADLASYKTKNKSDLAAVLNDHLRANQSRYSRDELFSEFYERMSRATGRATPTTPSTGSPRRSPRKAKVQEVEDVEYVNLVTRHDALAFLSQY